MKYSISGDSISIFRNDGTELSFELPLKAAELCSVSENGIAAVYDGEGVWLYSSAAKELAETAKIQNMDAMFFASGGERLLYHIEGENVLRELFSDETIQI